MAINRTSPKKGKVVDIPTAPTIGTATAGGGQATVAFTAATRGGPAFTYTALSNPGSITGTGSSSPVTVSGLTAGTAYTFTVRGTNATGIGEYSSASNSVTPLVNTSYESIATQTVGSSGAASVTFSSIPSTYKHLQIRAIARTSATGGTTQNLNMTINNDTSAAYSFHQLLGGRGGASGYGENVNRSNCVQILHITTDSAAAGTFGAGIIDILDYTNTNKNHTVKTLRGQEQNNSDGGIALQSYLHTSTTAISRLDFFAGSGNLLQYSQFALYGIKG